jgi:ABC-2 type transport system permease protein
VTTALSIARHEWKVLCRDTAVRLATLAFVLAAAWAGHHGGRVAHRQEEERRAVLAERAELMSAVRARLLGGSAALPPAAAKLDPTKPFHIGMRPEPAVLPARATAPLAVGASDLLPAVTGASLLTGSITEADKGGPDSPVVRTGGHADLAFVLVFLLPLVVLVLSHDLLSGERSRGTLALIQAQGVRLGTLVLGKVIARGAIVSVLVVLAVGLGAAMGGVWPVETGAVSGLVAWVLIALAHAGFYLAAAAWVESRATSSARTALALGSLWTVTTLVLPVLASAAVGALRPLPSRIESVDAERSAQLDTRRDGDRLLARFYEDHPELRREPGAADDFSRAFVLVQRELDRTTAPILARLDRRIAGRQEAVDVARFLSPALLVDDALADVAGTAAHRHRRFLDQARRFDATWRDYWLPLVVASASATARHVAERPVFRFEDDTSALRWRRPAVAVAVLVAASLVLAALARARLRRGDRPRP